MPEVADDGVGGDGGGELGFLEAADDGGVGGEGVDAGGDFVLAGEEDVLGVAEEEVEGADGEFFGEGDEVGEVVEDGAFCHGGALVWDGEEDGACGEVEGLVEEVSGEFFAFAGGGFELVDGDGEEGVVEGGVGLAKGGACDEAAHGVGDDGGLVEGVLAAVCEGVVAGLVHGFAEFAGGGEPVGACGVVEEPDLVFLAEPGEAVERVDHGEEGFWGGVYAVDEDEGDFFGVVGLGEVESDFVGEAAGEEDFLDGEVGDGALAPVEGEGGGPVGGEGDGALGEGGVGVLGGGVEFPGGGFAAVEAEECGDGVGLSGGEVEGFAGFAEWGVGGPADEWEADAWLGVVLEAAEFGEFGGEEVLDVGEACLVWGGGGCDGGAEGGGDGGVVAGGFALAAELGVEA